MEMNESKYRRGEESLGSEATPKMIKSFADWLDRNKKIDMDTNANWYWVDAEDADAHYIDWQNQWRLEEEE